MEEKYLITFEKLKEICDCTLPDLVICGMKLCDIPCNEQNCPVLKELERPAVQITPVRGK